MIVKIVDGCGREAKTEAEQKEFFDCFRESLEDYGLDVQEISSERPTGGPITLVLSDDTEIDHLTRVFSSLADDLSAYYGEEIALGLEIEGLSEPVTVAGAFAES